MKNHLFFLCIYIEKCKYTLTFLHTAFFNYGFTLNMCISDIIVTYVQIISIALTQPTTTTSQFN